MLFRATFVAFRVALIASHAQLRCTCADISCMRNLAVIIVEDNQPARVRLADLVRAADPDATVSGFASAEQFAAHRADADIVFMDIGLEGMDGVEAARRLRIVHPDCLLIFVTGLRERIFEAMDAHPFHYLVKPIDAAAFARVYAEAAQEVRRRDTTGRRKLRIHTRMSDVVVDVAEILYVESRSRKVVIHTRDRVYEMYGAISALEEELGPSFYRSHRAYLVNMDHVRSYTREEIRLSNGEGVYLAQKKYADFAREYMWFLQKKHVVV